MKKILFTSLIICCICSMTIAQEQQSKSIGQISSTFRVRANTADTIRFASIRLIVDSLEESKEFVFESLRDENLTGLGIMANVTGGNYAGYRLLPGGEHFARKAAIIELEYDQLKIPTGYTPEDIHTFFYDEQEKKWTALHRISVDTIRHLIVSETSHFTDFINGIVKEPEMPEQAAFTPTMMNDIEAPSPFVGIPMVQAPQANNQGSAVIQYPIDIPAGRNGMQPSLGLTYSSAGGNGLLGVGWSMPQMAICVSSKWGVPRYDAVFESEQYVLDGVELTTFGPDGSADTLMQNTNIRRLRTTDSTLFKERRNESFNRIVRYGNSPSEYYWIVTDRTGTIYKFGMKPDGTGLDTTTVLRSEKGNIAHWALTEIEDQYGNKIRYYYSKPEGNLYIQLDSINYTGFGDDRGSYSVCFGYSTRTDIETNGRYGFLTSCNKTLCRIDIFNKGQFLNSYGFEYNRPCNKNRWQHTLKEIKKIDYISDMKLKTDCQHCEYGCRDLYGMDLIYSSTKFNYDTVPNDIFSGGTEPFEDIKIDGTHTDGFGVGGSFNIGFGGNTALKSLSGNVGYDYHNSNTKTNEMLIDINGDGLVDYVYRDGDSLSYRKQQIINGESSFASAKSIKGLTKKQQPRHVSYSNTVSAGLSFFAHLNGNFPFTNDYTNIYFSDVNSDGLPDLVTDDGVMFNILDEQGNPTFSYINQDSDSIGSSIISTTKDCKTIIYDGEVSHGVMCKKFIWGDAIKQFDKSNKDSINYYASRPNDYALSLSEDGQVKVYRVRLDCTDSMSEPFVEAVKVWIAPRNGAVNLSNTVALMQDTTVSRRQSRTVDGVEYLIQKNSAIIDSMPIDADDYGIYNQNINSINVDSGDILLFHLLSKKSNVFDRISVKQTITYQDNGEVYSSDSDYVCNGNYYFQAIDSGYAKVDVPIKSNIHHGSVKLRIMHNNLAIDSLLIGSATNTTMSSSFFVNMNDTIMVLIDTLGSSGSELGRIEICPQVHFKIDNVSDTAVYNIHYQMADGRFQFSKDSLCALFGPLYRGWGQFGYINRNGSRLIDLTRIINNQTSTINTIDVNDTTSLHQSVNNRSNTIDSTNIPSYDEIRSYLDSLHFYDPLADTTDWQPMQADVTTRNYISINQMAIASRAELSNSNIIERLYSEDIEYYDSPIPAATHVSHQTNGYGTKTIRRSAEGRQDNVNYGISIPFVKSGNSSFQTDISLSFGETVSKTDYMDLNGDGYPDILGTVGIQYTMPWGGLGEVRNIDSIYTNPSYHLSRNESFVSGPGCSGSGIPPIMSKTSGGNNRSHFSIMSNGSFSETNGRNNCTQNFTDMNGDGLPDIVVFENGICKVAYNLGYRFSQPFETPWDSLQIGNSTSTNHSVSTGTADWDIEKYEGHKKYKKPLEGLTKDSKAQFTEASLAIGTGYTHSTDKLSNLLIDLDGNGLLDLIAPNPNTGMLEINYNTGNCFEDSNDQFLYNVGESSNDQADFSLAVTVGGTVGFVKLSGTFRGSYNFVKGKTDCALIDMNGDGVPDLVTQSGDSLNVTYNSAARANMLRSIENSSGSTIEIDYDLSDSHRNSPHRMWQMTSVTIKDSSAVEGDSIYTVSYTYGNPHYDRMEREFYGYDTVTEIHNGQKVMTSVYDNRYFLTNGNILERNISDNLGNTYLRQTFSYVYADRSNNMSEVADGDYCNDANLIEKRQCDETIYYEPVTSSGNRVAAEKCYEYDKYRNVIRYENNGDIAISDDNLSADITYAIDTVRNMLSLVSQVVSSDGATNRTTKYSYNDQGSLTDVRNSINGTFAQKTYTYNQYGLVSSVMNPANHRNQRYTLTYDYDSIDYSHVTRMVDSYGYESYTNYETKYWNPIETQGINGERMRYGYDSIGRLTEIVFPKEIANGDSFTIRYKYHPINHIHYRKNNSFLRDSFSHSWIETQRFDVQNPNDHLRTIDIYDARGNKIQTKSTVTLDNSTKKFINDGVRIKDCFGRVVSQHYPTISTVPDYDYSNETDYAYNPTVQTYDIMDRELITTFPDNTMLKKDYYIKRDKRSRFRLVTHTMDALGNIGETYISPQEWTVQQSAALGTPDSAHTQLRYDAFGDRIMTIDPDGAVTTYRYDEMGRLTERNHPDAGSTLFIYDDASNLVHTATQRQQDYLDKTSYKYDYNRQIGIDNHLSNDSTVIEYGLPNTLSAGLPVKIVNNAGVELMEYDEMGNVSALTQFLTLPREKYPIGFRTEWHYDSWNRLLNMTYHDGETVYYTYNTAGQLLKMAGTDNYIDDILYDIFGNRLQLSYSNGATQEYMYDNMLRLSRARLSTIAEGQIKDITYTYDAIGNIVSQNNQQNALSSGLGGVSLQTYEYDAMNRLTHSSGGNFDAGVSYDFQQTYSPSGRIGDKFCDFTSQNDGFYYDASGYQMHALRKTMDGTTGVPCDFIYDENGNMQGYSVKEGAFVSYNIWNAANQMVATGNTRACGYYGYGYDGKRRYKLTGKTSVMSANAGDMVMDFSFEDYVLYPNSFITGTPKGYTKHYYAGSERIASRLMNCWHFNKNLDQYLNDSEQQILDALALSNEQFDFTFNERPQYMNYYVPDSVVDIQGNKIANTGGMPILNLAGYFKGDDVVHYNCEMLADNDCKSELVFTHSDHLGSSSWTTDASGKAIQHIEYLPFGEEFVNQRLTPYEDRYTFTGKELDAESNLYYYDARYNSSTYSQFNSPDPMSDKYPSVNPYLYCAGNPIMYVDPNGMDLEQRLKAIEKAFLYLKLNVGYEYNGKGEPGTKVDCSGMVSKCIVEGGEEDPVKNGTGNGVKRIADVCQEITRQSDIEVGNLIVFGNSKKLTHIAIIIKIEKDSDGNITNIYFIHSCSSKGCEINNIKNAYWGPEINGYYKWDMTMDGYQELDEVHVLAPSLIPPRQDKINCPKISPKELRLEMVNPILER